MQYCWPRRCWSPATNSEYWCFPLFPRSRCRLGHRWPSTNKAYQKENAEKRCGLIIVCSPMYYLQSNLLTLSSSENQSNVSLLVNRLFWILDRIIIRLFDLYFQCASFVWIFSTELGSRQAPRVDVNYALTVQFAPERTDKMLCHDRLPGGPCLESPTPLLRCWCPRSGKADEENMGRGSLPTSCVTTDYKGSYWPRFQLSNFYLNVPMSRSSHSTGEKRVHQ